MNLSLAVCFYCSHIVSSPEPCEGFLNFFVEKVNNARAQITPPTLYHSARVLCSVAFYQFEPVTFSLFAI